MFTNLIGTLWLISVLNYGSYIRVIFGFFLRDIFEWKSIILEKRGFSFGEACLKGFEFLVNLIPYLLDHDNIHVWPMI